MLSFLPLLYDDALFDSPLFMLQDVPALRSGDENQSDDTFGYIAGTDWFFPPLCSSAVIASTHSGSFSHIPLASKLTVCPQAL
ncbi:hypothetical protein B0H13DRAFT_2328781 [Mycena leptocephala]|nr:hypothetical protein B0H13DRAFT_2339340 [Mycena leptocephala]KAJ7911017.1 hypothetical protein B0H13DRAFT_2328781 [Mycena leptocephala]